VRRSSPFALFGTKKSQVRILSPRHHLPVIASGGAESATTKQSPRPDILPSSSVTGQRAEGTQQIVRAAEDLNRLTEALQQNIERFNLTDTSVSAPAMSAEKRVANLF